MGSLFHVSVPGMKGKSVQVELRAIGRRGSANGEQATATCSILYNQNKESLPEKIVLKFSSHSIRYSTTFEENEEERTVCRQYTGWNECKTFGNNTG